MPRKYYPNEARPLSIRVGPLRDELDARSDGSESGYRAVIMRDLARYYALLRETIQFRGYLDTLEDARYMFDNPAVWEPVLRETESTSGYYVYLDALERAHILVEYAGLSVDEALWEVGLVKENA
jgi:hypothetical protein